jgi:hypothetical protein
LSKKSIEKRIQEKLDKVKSELEMLEPFPQEGLDQQSNYLKSFASIIQAEILMMQGNTGQALHALNFASLIDHPFLWQLRVEIKYRCDDLSGAYSDINKALKIRPNDKQLLQFKQLITLRQGNASEIASLAASYASDFL